MSRFDNINKNSSISAVEFSPAPEGVSVAPQEQFTFFHIKENADIGKVKALLTSPQIGLEIVTESRMNGQPLLVTRGTKPGEDLLKALAANNENFSEFVPKKKINYWKLRGGISMIGQPLQFISGYLNKGGVDGATVTFATSNMIANLVNFTFGAEKSKDAYHLRMLKESFNRSLDKYLPAKQIPDVDESYNKKPKEGASAPPASFTTKAFNFMKRYSVTVGEIGLRYFGAFALAFPVGNWKKGIAEINANGGLKGLNYNTIKTSLGKTLNADKFTRYSGIAYLTGKTIAFTSKIPDPYNPAPHTPIDTFREKVTFRLSSSIEAFAGTIIAYDRLFKRHTNWPNKKFIPASLRGAHTRDWLGGIGGIFLAAGLVVRILAPFGTKIVDMDELNAHMTEGLANIPPEKLPQLLADTAVSVKKHFGDQAPEVGQIFTQLVNDLKRYHDISLPGMEPVGHTAKSYVPSLENAPSETKTKSFASDVKKSPAVALTRPASYKERAAAPVEPTALGA